MKLIDLGNDYYLAKFENIQYYYFLLTEGRGEPLSHDTEVLSWFSTWWRCDQEIGSLALGARFEYFDAPFLMRVGERIGKVIKSKSIEPLLWRMENGMHVFALR